MKSHPSPIFISYSRQDFFVKEYLVQVLQKAKLPFWVDTKEIEIGDVWRKKIHQAIKGAAAVIILVSPDANVSQWVSEELTIAQYLRKKIYPVLVRGTDFPFGINQLHYLDLRSGANLDKIDAFVKQIEQEVTVTAPSPEALPPRPSRTIPLRSEARPLPLPLMTVLSRLLDSAADLISTTKHRGRASLLWTTDHVYVAVSNTAGSTYTETELRLRLSSGQGFAGELWQQGTAEPMVHLPHQTPEIYMRDRWEFDAANIVAVKSMGVILSVPILHQGRFVGILSLDNEEKLSKTRLTKSGILKKAKEIGDTISQMSFAAPLPYYKYRHLQNITNVARLLARNYSPTRSGIYWVDEGTQELRLVAASEAQITKWATRDRRYKQGEDIIGQAWERGTLLVEDRLQKSLDQIQQGWNLSDSNLEFANDVGSVVCAPLRTKDSPVVGILAIESTDGLQESGLDLDRVSVNELANLAARVLLEPD